MAGPPIKDYATLDGTTKTALRQYIVREVNASEGVVGQLNASPGSLDRLSAKLDALIAEFGDSHRAERTKTGNATCKDLSEHERNLWTLYWNRKDYIEASAEKRKDRARVRRVPASAILAALTRTARRKRSVRRRAQRHVSAP